MLRGRALPEITAPGLTFVGQGLSRPECVWIDNDGVWVSDLRGGVSLIQPDGSPRRLGSGIATPNGFSRRPDGSFVVAGLEDGAVHRIAPDGTTSVLLDSIDGQRLGTVNCAWADGPERVWVSVMTRGPRWHEALNSGPDGYIALIDRRGARIVADGLHLTNEVKTDPSGRYLYAAETLGRRIVRFAIGADGALGAKETVGPDDLGHGGLPDGFGFDPFGNVWVTLVCRNAVAVIKPDGELRTVFEEVRQPALDTLVAHLAAGTAELAHVGACAGETFPMPTSVAFGGADGRTVYVGSLAASRLATFRMPGA